MSGYRNVPKKKWCQVCNGYMAHEYREPRCPPTHCNACWRRMDGCSLLAFLALVVLFMALFEALAGAL